MRNKTEKEQKAPRDIKPSALVFQQTAEIITDFNLVLSLSVIKRLLCLSLTVSEPRFKFADLLLLFVKDTAIHKAFLLFVP